MNKSIDDLLKRVTEDPSHRNYWFAHKKINELQSEERDLKIALLSSQTIDLLKIYLDIDSRLLGLTPEIYVGPFNQYRQAIMDPSSKMYEISPDIILLNIHLESILNPDFVTTMPKLSVDEIQEELSKLQNEVTDLLDLLSENTSALILFTNFIIPSMSPLGILESKSSKGIVGFVRTLNSHLERTYIDHSQIHIFDLDGIAAYFGKKRVTDNKLYYRGTMLFSEEFLPILSSRILSYVKALKNKNRKALILDLDNTLWGGIIGEDGIEGIKLNPNHPGKEFYEFQKYIKSLYHRGIILAINSKNNYEDAMEAIVSHPSMVLKDEYFAVKKINWQDKVQNIIEIAEELNIGLDSLVFLDDNPVERTRVRTSLPDVLVPDLPENPHDYLDTLRNLNDFNTLALTDEDLNRGEMYVARGKRKSLASNIQSIDDFIQSLEITAHIKKITDYSLPRVASLVNRTNQFNATTRRYTEHEIQTLSTSGEMDIYTLQVEDKFGDEGIVGVAMVKKENNELFIDNFLMSCRVIGRKIETAFLIHIINSGTKAGFKTLHAEYIPTKKNKLVEELFDKHNFEIISRENGTKKYRHNLNKVMEFPEFLTIKTDA